MGTDDKYELYFEIAVFSSSLPVISAVISSVQVPDNLMSNMSAAKAMQQHFLSVFHHGVISSVFSMFIIQMKFAFTQKLTLSELHSSQH